MGVIDRAGTEEGPRPKYLTRSGEFKAVHAGQNVPANDVGEGGDLAAVLSFPARLRSQEKAGVRMEVVEMLAACVVLHRLTNADLGATINETAEDVRRIRDGMKPLTADHLLRIARRRPELWADIRVRLEGTR